MLTATEHKGIQTGLSAEGVQVVRIHYTADPLKDPATPEGAKWIGRELQGYRGKTDPRWRKEMEIDFDAHGGQLLFPYMLDSQAINYDNDINIAYEYYEAPKKSDETDDAFRKRKGHKVLCAAIKQCPYFQGLTILADPSLWNKTQESVDSKGLMSIADLFLQEGVALSPGQRGRDFACYEHIDKNLWKEPARPKLTISQNCPWLWWEMQRLRFSDYSATTQVNQNLQEKIVDKDNHCYSDDTDILTQDGWKRFCNLSNDDKVAVWAGDDGLSSSI
jgi:hypothetical protein